MRCFLLVYPAPLTKLARVGTLSHRYSFGNPYECLATIPIIVEVRSISEIIRSIILGCEWEATWLRGNWKAEIARVIIIRRQDW